MLWGEKMKKSEDVFSTIVFMYLVFSTLIILIVIFLLDLILSDSVIATVGPGLIGALGSMIGGFFTLIGVRWTLQGNKKQELQSQYIKTKYVYSRLYPYVVSIQNSIKSINPTNINHHLDLIQSHAGVLVKQTQIVLDNLEDVNEDLFEVIIDIEYYANYLLVTLENLIPGMPDQEIKRDLELIRNYIAKCDQKLGNVLLKTRGDRIDV
jgi:hypothetical protein